MRLRRRERGEINFLKIVLLLALAAGVYATMKFGPVYLEHARVKRLMKQAAAYWLNITPDLDEVKKKLDRDLEQAMVESVTSDEITLEKVTNDEVYTYVQYEVTVEHPALLKPTVLTFEFEHTEHRRMRTD